MKVRVKALAHGGACVSKQISLEPTDQGQKTVFVREVIPGEEVEVEVLSDNKNYIEARLKEIIKPSPHRILPVCPKFGICGGCDLMHMELSLQREEKRKMIEETVRIQGKLKIPPVKILGEKLIGLNYRRRIQLHLSTDGKIGFYRSGSGEVVDISYCFLATPAINAAFERMRAVLIENRSLIGGVTLEEDERGIHLLLKLREKVKVTDTELKDLRATFKPHCATLEIMQIGKENRDQIESTGRFSQVNKEANNELIEAVLKNVTNSEVTELFAGSGNLSLPLAKAGRRVEAIEVDKILAECGQSEAKAQALAVTFHTISAERYVRQHRLSPAVVLDPPRSGAKEVFKNWQHSQVEEVVYVSCNLPTLTRDLRTLSEQGFNVKELFFIDMFPQTHHVEMVVVLRR